MRPVVRLPTLQCSIPQGTLGDVARANAVPPAAHLTGICHSKFAGCSMMRLFGDATTLAISIKNESTATAELAQRLDLRGVRLIY